MHRTAFALESITTPRSESRRGNLRQNKRNKNSIMRVADVHVQSVLRPYKADNILNFSIRYQTAGTVNRTVNRGQLLNTLLLNVGPGVGGTSNFRLCAAVRVNRVKVYTSGTASLEWLSAYGPTSATVVSGTSTTAAGESIQRPPKNSLCAAWSLTGSNESELMLVLTATAGDYVDVDYSVVLFDQETPVPVTTVTVGFTGRLYRSYLDGPGAGAAFNPIYILSIF